MTSILCHTCQCALKDESLVVIHVKAKHKVSMEQLTFGPLAVVALAESVGLVCGACGRVHEIGRKECGCSNGWHKEKGPDAALLKCPDCKHCANCGRVHEIGRKECGSGVKLG